MKISIQGYIGSFHHIVAKHFFGNDIELLERNTFEEVFKDTVNQENDVGIIAIENSIAGSIRENYDLFLKYHVFIVNEVYLRIVQNLIVLPDIDIDDINEVHSHVMAIKQCERFLSQYPSWKIVETTDTALSISDISKNKWENIAGIASSLSAEVYDMKILIPSIETNHENYTRFFLISNKEIIEENANKISIVCQIDHKPGALAGMLNILTENNINLTKIESRPVVGDVWKYYFYIDFESNIYKSNIIDLLREYSTMLKVIGVYPSGVFIS